MIMREYEEDYRERKLHEVKIMEFTDVKELPQRGYHRLAVARCEGFPYLLKGINADYINDYGFLELLRLEFERLRYNYHPCLPTIIGFQAESPIGPCIVEEWVRTVSFSEYLSHNYSRMDRRIVAGEIANLLEFFHSRDLVHGDIRPYNIFISLRDNRPFVVDMAMSDSEAYKEFISHKVHDDYVAPEVAAGGECDARSDVYAFGAILKDLDLGRETDWIVKKCLNKNPSNRFQSGRELAAFFRSEQPYRRRKNYY